MERRFIAEAHADFAEKLEAAELDTEQKQKKLLDAYAEELQSKYPEWANCKFVWLRGQDLIITCARRK
ncbi:hypothetical protein IE4872_CH03398 [Rhizobium gallicum]|uniref:Uncharacterized protein n=2 Tax=Rhizobium gallicum TaxID=56730 RepID=A0A1L5NM92_9HYPH|nr:hypothetical protein IE4872_CH03398 [Rhizobium gallicum]